MVLVCEKQCGWKQSTIFRNFLGDLIILLPFIPWMIMRSKLKMIIRKILYWDKSRRKVWSTWIVNLNQRCSWHCWRYTGGKDSGLDFKKLVAWCTVKVGNHSYKKLVERLKDKCSKIICIHNTQLRETQTIRHKIWYQKE